MKIERNAYVIATWLAASWMLSAQLGCGRPQVAPENRELIASLRTAVNTRNTEWLEKNAKILEERRAAGQISDTAYEQFQAIIAKARSGNWEEAEQEAIAFQKAQRPTREEIQRVTEPGQ